MNVLVKDNQSEGRLQETSTRIKTRKLEAVTIEKQIPRKKPKISLKEVDKSEEPEKYQHEGEINGDDVDYSRVELRKWDIKTFTPDSTCVFYGKRRTGKSFFMRWLLYTMRKHYTHVWVFTQTAMNKFWTDYVPINAIFPRYSSEMLSMILDLQSREFIKYYKEIKNGTYNPYKAVIFEDVVTEKQVRSDPVLKRMFANGRHHKLGIFFATQWPKAIPPILRGNVDIAGIFAQTNLMAKESLADDYLGSVKTRDAYKIIDKNTEDHQVLLVDYAKVKPNLQEYAFTAKATDPGKFILGCPESWKMDPRYGKLISGSPLTEEDNFTAFQIQHAILLAKTG